MEKFRNLGLTGRSPCSCGPPIPGLWWENEGFSNVKDELCIDEDAFRERRHGY